MNVIIFSTDICNATDVTFINSNKVHRDGCMSHIQRNSLLDKKKRSESLKYVRYSAYLTNCSKSACDLEGRDLIINHLDSILSVSLCDPSTTQPHGMHPLHFLHKALQKQVAFNFLSPLVLEPGTGKSISKRGLIIHALIPVELSDIYSAVSREPRSFEFCFVSGTACALHSTDVYSGCGNQTKS